nr:hypothetical protein [Tanacetum cinerariifolium]
MGRRQGARHGLKVTKYTKVSALGVTTRARVFAGEGGGGIVGVVGCGGVEQKRGRMELQSQAHVGEVTIQEPVAEATRPLPVVKGKGADSDKTTSGGDTEILQIDEDQGLIKPGKTPESRPPPEQEFMEEDQVRPDPRLPVDEHVILEEPLSSSRTLSPMKNLDNDYTFKDQFLNDKSTEDDLGKLKDSKVVSMVMVPIHQVSSLVTLLSTSIINLYPPRPVPATTHAPTFTATTTPITINLKPPPLPPQQSTSDSKLATRVAALEQKLIDQTVNTVVKKAVHIALQAPLRNRFRELPEADMNEILHQRMFESHRIMPDIRKPLPLGGPTGQVTIQSQYFFNKDLEYVVSRDKGRRLALSISKLKAAQYLDFGLEELVSSFWIESYTIVSKPRAVIYKDGNDQKKMMRVIEDDRRRSKEFMEVIEHRLKLQRIFKSLESFVGGRLRDVDYRLIQRTK